MPSSSTARRPAAAAHADPHDMLPAVQETLAILADLAFAHASARERLALWDGPEAVKTEIARDLDARHAAAAAPYERRLAALQERAAGTRTLAAVD
ncbi:hypothetical protein [Salinarimonas chemoclinalis]|uniref:hypothetical protein n=1 Tax=Salinarimonas chemoclinalis TaxID=3241599 RepID=UPI003558867F